MWHLINKKKKYCYLDKLLCSHQINLLETDIWDGILFGHEPRTIAQEEVEKNRGVRNMVMVQKDAKKKLDH